MRRRRTGGAVGGEGVHAGEEEDGIAREGVAAQPVEDVVAQVLHGPVDVGEHAREQPGAARAVLGPVGGRQRGRAEGEDITVGDGDGGGDERGGPLPSPRAAPTARSRTPGVSSGPASVGGGCPAEAMAQVRENGSYITHRHVALSGCLRSGSSAGSAFRSPPRRAGRRRWRREVPRSLRHPAAWPATNGPRDTAGSPKGGGRGSHEDAVAPRTGLGAPAPLTHALRRTHTQIDPNH